MDGEANALSLCPVPIQVCTGRSPYGASSEYSIYYNAGTYQYNHLNKTIGLLALHRRIKCINFN